MSLERRELRWCLDETLMRLRVEGRTSRKKRKSVNDGLKNSKTSNWCNACRQTLYHLTRMRVEE
jgi:hypothetical protein